MSGLLVAALLWIGAELHYRNCIEAAEARTPAPPAAETDFFGVDSAQEAHRTRRRQAIDGCSRWPF